MAFLHFDAKYAPCGFLIVRDGADPYSNNPEDTTLIQTDWDFPGIASTIGLEPCDCGMTDGTVSCEHKGVSEMISAAYDYCREHAGESFVALDDYLTVGV